MNLLKVSNRRSILTQENNMADHKLYNLLLEAAPVDEEVLELYNDLKFVFEATFDDAIHAAMARGSHYVAIENTSRN